MKRMKRMMAVSAAAASALILSCTAWAGTTLETVGTVDFADDWIDGTDLLAKPDSSGAYALADMNGNVLSSGTYARIGYSAGYGFLSATGLSDTVNNTGALNLSGEEVIPCEYGDIEFLNEHWIRAVTLTESTADQYDYTSLFSASDKYYLIDTVDFYYAEDGKVTKAGSLKRADYMDDHAYGRYINIEDRSDQSIKTYDRTWNAVVSDDPASNLYEEVPGADDAVRTYYENGRYGLRDASGKVILEADYGFLSSFYGGYAKAENYLDSGDVCGLVDETGKLAVPVEYEDVEYAFYAPETAENGYSSYAYNNFGYYCVIKDGKLGYVDEAGNVTCDFAIARDNCENNGASATYTDMGGAKHLLAADGTDTDISQYENVSPMQGGSGMYYRVSDTDYHYGVIDWHGDVVADVVYSGIDLSGDGQYLLLQKEYGTPCELDKLTFSPNGAAPASSEAQDTEASSGTSDGSSTTGTEASSEAPDAGDSGDGEASSADISSISSLLDSAITLASSDAAANREAIRSLVQSAAAQIGDSKPDVKTLLDSAVTLLNSDSVDGSSVVSLLTSAKTLLE